MQPGPIYFKVPLKVGIFGVCCESLPRQVNFLNDEAGSMGKGANATISYCCEATRLRSRLISVKYVTSLGFLRQYQPCFRNLDVCMYVCRSPNLPRFQLIEIEAISCFVQIATFCGEEFEVKCPIWTNSWNFETLWNSLECGNTLKPLEMVRILFKYPLRKCWGKSILLVCVHYPHAGECVTALRVIFFVCAEMLFCRMIWYWYIYSCGKVQDITQVKLLLSFIVSKSSDICECKSE